MVDTTAPTSSVTTATLANTGNATVQSSETGTAYLVNTNVSVSNEASITGASDASWNTVAVSSANTNTSLALTGLVDGTYKLYTVDAAGNLSSASTNSVTLDATGPTVNSVVITSASGIQNNSLNAGDVLTATVTLNEAATVTTTSGTPYINLNIGGTTVQASYASGSGTTALSFTYTILSGQTDANGISIDANSLSLNSGTITDAVGNSATLTHSAVSDNASFMVDTTAPTASVTTATLANTDSATVQSSETGTAYLVNTNVSVTNEASITGASDTSWNTVAISTANNGTNLALTGLVDGTYKLYTVDAAGNLSSASNNSVRVNSNSQAGNALIDLGSYGKLIAPVQVEGNWYYYWDRSGDGTSANSGSINGGVDTVTHDVLDSLFNQDSSGNTGSGGNTNNTYRYASLNGVLVALPTYGGALDGSGFAAPTQGIPNYQNNTSYAVGSTSSAARDTVANSNATYDDMLAIWDGHNTSGSATSQASGVPPSWKGNYYWSATLSSAGHAGIDLNNGYIFNLADTNAFWVALQVIGTQVDTVAPTVSTVAITAASNMQNGYLNAGDVVTATVTMSEAVTVTGTPRLALNINGTSVQASYASGSGTGLLRFTYTILPGQTDATASASTPTV